MKQNKFECLVWFKKDLRSQDHLPLKKALNKGKTLALFIIEEKWLESPECSDFHKQFLKESLEVLAQELEALRIPFVIQVGNAVDVLDQLHKKYKFNSLFSHEETGLMWTFKRDLQVKQWAGSVSVDWDESKQFAVARGLKDRDKWNKLRPQIIERSVYNIGAQEGDFLNKLDRLNESDLEALSALSVKTYNSQLLKGGSQESVKTLDSFLNERGENYYKEMSSPCTAYDSCSRLSPYITWGCLSLSQIHSALLEKRKTLRMLPFSQEKSWERSLQAFESRLWWHCHFIQKLESEPEIEFENMNRAFDGMRGDDFNQEHFEAWKKGETGFPLIDACMRALLKNGWINFRMRAMLVSFASYQLWIPWQKLSHHLAQLFLDFEPGIHFSQLQMQSGVTGINSIRIYSPLKQTQDQDPDGVFIKEYCPELNEVDKLYLADLQSMPPLIQKMAHLNLGENYPFPIVDHKEAYKSAKGRIFEWRKKALVVQESKKVYQKHGSRRHKKFPKQTRKIF